MYEFGKIIIYVLELLASYKIRVFRFWTALVRIAFSKETELRPDTKN